MKSKQKDFYDNRYSIMRRALHKLQNMLVVFYDMRLIKTMLRVGEVNSVDSVLEVGCGQGTDAILVSKHVRNVIAVDVSSNTVKIAKALSETKVGRDAHASTPAERLSFLVSDAEYLPLRKDTFDIVFCKDLLHHVPNSLSAILEMKRVAKKAGKVVALEANAFNLQMIFIGLVYFAVDKGVFKNTRAKLIATFEMAGLSRINLVESEFLPRHILFEYRSPICRLSASSLALILRIVQKMEDTMQNLPMIRRFANYLIVRGVKV